MCRGCVLFNVSTLRGTYETSYNAVSIGIHENELYLLLPFPKYCYSTTLLRRDTK